MAAGLKTTSKKNAAKAETTSAEIAHNIETLDEIFASAGLTRNRRGSKRNILSKARQNIYSPEELRRPIAAKILKAKNGVVYLAVPSWEKFDWLWHGFSTRKGGVSSAYAIEGAPGELNLGFTADDTAESVAENRHLITQAITGSRKTPLRTVKQFHSGLVLYGPGCAGEKPFRADGLLTDRPGELLGVQTADCIPVIVADKKKKIVAAFHAGWRGTVQRIVERGVGRMRLEFGSDPDDLIAAVGPGVGPCCYAVGEEVQSEFESQFSYAAELFHEVFNSDPVKTRYPMLFLTQRAPGHSNIGPSTHLDLQEANRRQLLAAGLSPKAVHVLGGCTQCDREFFFSHRGAQGRAGRMMGMIGIADK
jgi:YfiH family protein